MSNALVAVDARLFAGEQEVLMGFGSACALLHQGDGFSTVAVATFQGVVGFDSRPLMGASTRRILRNFSRVLIEPNILPHTSFDA